MEQPRPKDLVGEAGISMSYASEILSGNRDPSRSLAIHIFRRTGWRHPRIAALSDEQIGVLETVEPWVPKSAPAPQEAA